jgi:hypothetical protein
MKQTPVLKSLSNVFLKIPKPAPVELAKASQTPDSTSEHQLREALVLIRAEENSSSTGYRHWGLNE